MFVLTIQTGLRISELTGLTCSDVTLGTGAHVHSIGKGRKERRTPLVPATVRSSRPGSPSAGHADRPAVPDHDRQPLSRDAIEHRIAHHLTLAATRARRSGPRRVTTHTLRHTAAMRLLLAGNDITVIALWLGHEQVATTNIYLHADMTHKQQAIDRTETTRHQTRSLPAPRRPPRLPRGPVIMPTTCTPSPQLSRHNAAEVGITRRSA